jgi:hypothetical protein
MGLSNRRPFVSYAMSFLFSFGVRLAVTTASLALALAPAACSSSSTQCVESPGPPQVATLVAPCGLVITSITATGPCTPFGGTTSTPAVEGNGTGGGTCTVTATFSNGSHATGSVTFTASACGELEPSSSTIALEGGACDAGAPSDATAG